MRSKVMTACPAARTGNGSRTKKTVAVAATRRPAPIIQMVERARTPAPPRVAAEPPEKAGELPIPVATLVSTGRTTRRTTQAMRISVVALVWVACGSGGTGSVSLQRSALEIPGASVPPVLDAAPLDQTAQSDAAAPAPTAVANIVQADTTTNLIVNGDF